MVNERRSKNMSLGLKLLIVILAILCISFTFIGVYTLDISLISIGILFAVSIMLIVLEAQKRLTNPFSRK